MATTRKDLRQRIGKAGFLGDTIVSTATGGSISTLIDTKGLVNQDTTLVGSQVVVTSGLGSTAGNNRRLVLTYASQTITPDSNFAGAIANADAYELHRVFWADHVDDAINAAIREAKLRWPVIVEDTSLTWTNNTYTYSIGNLTTKVDPFALIEKVEYDTGASGTGYPYAVLSDEEWWVRNVSYVPGTAASLVLQFKKEANDLLINGKTIRLTYRVRPATLSDDTTAIAPDEEGFYEFVSSMATAYIAERAHMYSRAAGQLAFWAKIAEFHRARADGIFSSDRRDAQYGKIILSPGTGGSGYSTWNANPARIHVPSDW